MSIQQLLETMYITLEKGSGDGLSMNLIGEARTTNSFLSKLTSGHKVLETELNAVEFLMPEL
jgi:hypothetical protein